MSHHQQTDQEKKAAENDDGSVQANSSNGPSWLSCDLRNHPWTSTEFVELWSDIPSEFNINLNRSEGRKELTNRNDEAPSSNATDLSRDMTDAMQLPAATSGISTNQFFEFEKLTEVSSIAQDDSISNHNYFGYPEQDKVPCCRILSACSLEIQNFAMSFRKEICILVMKVLLSLLPLSAFLMGVLHFGTCPANEVVTLLVYMTGIMGVFLSGTHIAIHFTNERKEEIRRATNLCQIITALLLLIEMIVFYSMSPSFENAANYCDRTFYNYIFFMNIAAAGIVFPSVLLQYFSCKHLVNIEAFYFLTKCF